MALLQRLFQNRRNAKQYNLSCYGREESPNGSQCRPQLDKSKIRLLIIADTEKGRVPYFDSNAIRRIDDTQLEQKKGFKSACRLVPGNKNTKDGGNGAVASSKPEPKYQFQKMGSDVKLLEEMMFGAVAMAYKGSTLKVHHIRCPPQLVVTKVFYPDKPKPDSASVDTDSDSTPSSLSSSYADHFGDISTPVRKVKSSNVTSIPMDVPFVRESFVDSCDEDSGLYSLTSSGSFQSLFPSPSNNSTNSYNSLHRRWMRSQTTSLQRRWDSQETLNSMENSQMRKKKQIKLAIGILFSTSDGKSFQEGKDSEEYRIFQSFFFSHMALIEGHVEGLRSSVERAFFTGKNMVPSIFEALDTFRNAMHDLYMGPRLREPVWLSMMSNVSYKYALCERFIHEFMFLAAKYDNKSTKFFISTLLSAVLTYHLAWVATVTPGDGTPSKSYLDKHSSKWIDALAKTHPYNPLWAQLGDLYGAIGNPLRVARTVVVGRKADLVNKILYVLGYFIRCSDVHEAPFSSCLPAVLESQCWDHGGPIKSVSSMDGSTATLVEMVPAPLDSPSQPVDVADTAMCSSCGSCTSALQFYSTQGKKVTSPSPKRAVNSKLNDPDRTCAKSLVAVSQGGSDIPVTCGQEPNETAAYSGGESEGRTVSDDSGIENSGSYDQTGRVKKNSKECRMFDVQIVEDRKLENVQHVQRSAESGPSLTTEELITSAMGVDSSQDGYSKRPVSMLAWQLAADSEDSATMAKQRALIKQAQKLFLDGGSSSMFEEYFDGDVETKTIDDLCEHQRVVKHPLVGGGSSVGNSVPTSPPHTHGGHEDGTISPQLKTSVSRQSSTDAKPHMARPTSLNPARTRSVTPTELNRRRHLSSTSSVDMDVFDPLVHCQEINMPAMTCHSEQLSLPGYDKNFGRSLLGGYSDHYMSDFVLHGTSDTSFRPKLLQDLQSTLQHSILDEPVAESVCIIADTDNWTVEVANSRLLEMSSSGTMPWTTSHLVASLIESVLDLHRLKMSAEFCIMHLEDRMQEMYFKSLMLAEYIKGVKSHSQQQLTAMLGFDASDLPLLLSIAGTHTPNLALGSEAKIRPPF